MYYRLQQVLLQSEEELMTKRSLESCSEGAAAASKPKKVVGKLKVQVRKVRMSVDAPTGCSIQSIKMPILKLDSVRYRLFSIKSAVSSGWTALRKVRFAPQAPIHGSFSRQSMAYVQASTQYIKQVSGLLKIGVTTLRNNSSSYDVQETYSCLLRLKSSSEDDSVPMQQGSSESHVFFPDSLGDDLIVEVRDSKGKQVGRVLAQVVSIAEDPADKLRWWSIYHEPEHELVGKLQLYINYTTSSDDNNLKCGSVAETVAYDIVMEVAMKAQQFQQRNLLIDGSWNWLLTEFASYYGVSSIYTKLRYVSYIMEVATPTSDCLNLVYDLLLPVIMKGHPKSTLSHQENRILGEIRDHLEHILALVFENYKSLDESSFSGLMDVFKPATGITAPALKPAVMLYTLLHDILLPEVQTNLCQYFQVAAKRRSRRHLTETDEYVTNNSEGSLFDSVTICTAYQKMKSLCWNIRNEIFTDIEIHNKHILPSFIDLPNLSSSIYSTELSNRMRALLIACPPTGPSPPVAELVIATSDLQRDIACWGISPIKGGVDAKELFHLYIMIWIQDKRLSLLEMCKLDKIKWAGVRTKHSTTPFVDEMYDRLKETLNEYDIIICRWPEYIFTLENAIADVEKAIMEALDKQYADVLAPLKDNIGLKKFGFKYVQKLAKRSTGPYVVPDELGILLNSMKRMLDVLRPKIEIQLKSWGACILDGGNTAPGDSLSEVTVMLRAKFRNYMQAIVELLLENTKLQSSTKLKKILQDSKNNVVEADVRSRMQPLTDQLTSTISHLHAVFENQVFSAICRGFWDRIGQEVLSFLENRKENSSWYKGSRVAVSVLDDTFASQMQHLLGNYIQEKDLEPPRSIMEVRSIMCKEAKFRH
uniref:Pesticidal crystal cry8Ba protein n=1 Tax=Kalanchoe fedtschenkoi TaxID=63787 RepID=A0A7N0UPJ1_KALFE